MSDFLSVMRAEVLVLELFVMMSGYTGSKLDRLRKKISD